MLTISPVLAQETRTTVVADAKLIISLNFEFSIIKILILII